MSNESGKRNEMTDRGLLIEQTWQLIQQLPDEKLSQIADFAGYLMSRHEAELLSGGISLYNAQSASFDFLEEEEELYSLDDLKERYR